MSVDSKKALAYAAITITASILLTLGITITFNYTYVNQQFTNIYSTLSNIQEQVSEIPKEPVVVNVTFPNTTQPTNVTQPPIPVPIPQPKPTCDPIDEVYNSTLNECTAKPVPVPPTPTPAPVPPIPAAKPFTFTVVGDVYNSATGYPVKDVNASQGTLFKDRMGRIWIATGSSKTALIRFDPEAVQKTNLPPAVIIQQLRVDENPVFYIRP